MRVTLHLQEFCIEKTAKQLYESWMKQIFQSENPPESILSQKMEILGQFIQSTDFKRLRSQFPELSGHCEITVFLEKQTDGSVTIVWK